MTMNRNQYPCVEFDLDKLAANLAALVERCHDSLIEVAGVVKAVSSLPEIVRVYEESGVKFIATSRISQMRAIREAGICKKPLMLIRIPMLSELPDVVELCDISLQSDIIVLRALNEEAKKQGKVHEVILMMDLGDLREGFWNEEDALDAALEIEHELKNLRLAGVGVNLSCYGSVLPTKRNMQGLVSLASDIEREIGRKLDYISGGASTSAYMAMNGTMPYRINLLRLGDIGLRGETDNFAPDFLETGVMTIKAEVIECRDKPSFPVGELSVNAFGEVGHYEDRGIRRRALVAMGRVDYGNCFDLVPRMEGIEVIGASSDHTILDVEAVKDKVHVGDVLEFGIKAYGPMAYLTSSDGVHMVFKGGTSLSKCYKLIQRFSEDIDLNVEDRPSEGQRKALKRNILAVVDDLGLSLSNAEEIRSRRDYNRYVINYPALQGATYLKQQLIVETVVSMRAFPNHPMDASSFIYDFLKDTGREDIIREYNLQPFSINVQAAERTLLDKLFALADYYLNGSITEHSRHIYDIYKLSMIVTIDDTLRQLASEVILERRSHKVCLSAQEGVDMNNLLRQIVDSDAYRSDYEQITSALLFEDVSYSTAITALQHIIDSRVFQ